MRFNRSTHLDSFTPIGRHAASVLDKVFNREPMLSDETPEAIFAPTLHDRGRRLLIVGWQYPHHILVCDDETVYRATLTAPMRVRLLRVMMKTKKQTPIGLVAVVDVRKTVHDKSVFDWEFCVD